MDIRAARERVSRIEFLEEVLPAAMTEVLRGLDGDPEYLLILGGRREGDEWALSIHELVRSVDGKTPTAELRTVGREAALDVLRELKDVDENKIKDEENAAH